PVYRTYLRETGGLSEEDERRIRTAVRLARRRNPLISASVFAFLEDVLLARGDVPSDARPELVRFALRFQQITGPVMAKAVEDTAFYRFNRLVSRNEVGGIPSKFSVSVEEFHAQNAERARRWPLSMITTSTHDTKRGEDARARISVLSEVPDEWRRAVGRWTEIAKIVRTAVDGEPAPSRSLEYLFYQTVVGCWPPGWDGGEGRDELVRRLTDFLLKASKEGKEQTSWTNPNAPYDEAVRGFAAGMFASQTFVDDMRRFVETIASHGASNGLAQCLLRMTSPGVPDTYQGSELWDQTLVDPDNRKPIDFGRRRAMLARMNERAHEPRALAKDLLETYADGAVKLHVLHQALLARKAHPALFLRGDYEPLPGGEHVIAFTRAFGQERLVCCVPRLTHVGTRGSLPWMLGEAWGDEALRVPHAGTYRNLMTGAKLEIAGEARLAELFADFPVALLIREERKA
ncbi:MAG: malto-oligosyltrehalose synthase, partial [Polyangiaceae bacterium]